MATKLEKEQALLKGFGNAMSIENHSALTNHTAIYCTCTKDHECERIPNILGFDDGNSDISCFSCSKNNIEQNDYFYQCKECEYNLCQDCGDKEIDAIKSRTKANAYVHKGAGMEIDAIFDDIAPENQRHKNFRRSSFVDLDDQIGAMEEETNKETAKNVPNDATKVDPSTKTPNENDEFDGFIDSSTFESSVSSEGDKPENILEKKKKKKKRHKHHHHKHHKKKKKKGKNPLLEMGLEKEVQKKVRKLIKRAGLSKHKKKSKMMKKFNLTSDQADTILEYYAKKEKEFIDELKKHANKEKVRFGKKEETLVFDSPEDETKNETEQIGDNAAYDPSSQVSHTLTEVDKEKFKNLPHEKPYDMHDDPRFKKADNVLHEFDKVLTAEENKEAAAAMFSFHKNDKLVVKEDFEDRMNHTLVAGEELEVYMEYANEWIMARCIDGQEVMIGVEDYDLLEKQTSKQKLTTQDDVEHMVAKMMDEFQDVLTASSEEEAADAIAAEDKEINKEATNPEASKTEAKS